MIDSHGRRIHKLRISVTDHCQFRCVYCLPQNAGFTATSQFLTFAEIEKLIPAFVAMGIDTVRITGGEPLLRSDLSDLIERLKRHNLRVGLTTNGQLLSRRVRDFKLAGLDSVNVSLDALDPGLFQRLSGFDGLSDVLASIEAALEQNLTVKVNAVILKDINENQIIPLLKFAQAKGIEARFLELMKIGPLLHHHEKYFVPADQIVSTIEEELGKLNRQPAPIDSTAILYSNDQIQKLGIIASESYPFCENCSRLRLTAAGKLFGCMMQTQGVDLKAYLRWMPEQIPAAIAEAIAFKPMERISVSAQNMYVLGG